MDALPVPKGWVPDAWFKAYNAADSQIYHLVGKDCRISKRKRDSGETRERALGLWERYPMNKVMWAEKGREEREAGAGVAVMVEEEENESGDESGEGEEEEEDEEDGDEESEDDEDVGRGAERVWQQEVAESEEGGDDEEVVEEMDEDVESCEETYDVNYLFEDF
ncbi:hypothetical protein V497_08886 [Pseudogymnoascus sp. VKM F-4516 (FW-969)]|nr:hypothetical protein V490_07675 [Pseudogymnoascus sp. VKM F-3557]KFY51739.1 hypothetical protein V497_08886 [Pseudogymnoascus sp. VKM F-4516 (FW-969)]